MAGTGAAHLRPAGDVILQVDGLEVTYAAGRGRNVSAVSGPSFDVAAGETLGLVGESGCGKSTTARAIMGLESPTAGTMAFDGMRLETLGAPELRRVRTGLQMIFQDPIASLNPRRRVADIVREGLDIWPDRFEQPQRRVADALAEVGMDVSQIGDRRPHEFSGGQAQRICIARALVMAPRVLICDEPVSALDVSIQAQILNLLEDLKQSHGLTMLFIAHDLAVVKSISDQLCVMYLGRVCEIGPTEAIFDRPAHPYTEALLESIPQLDTAEGESDLLRGDPPSPAMAPSGCRFRTRCDRATERCAAEEPELALRGLDHPVACHFATDASSAASGR